MADTGFRDRIDARLDRLSWSRRLSLTTRILAVNLLPLALLGGGIFYLDTYRKQLLSERYKLARIEAQITAEALAGASRQRQEALLIQIGKEQKMRLRMFDAEGRLWADSFELDEPAFEFDDVGDDPFSIEFARMLDRWVDTIVGADPIPDYIEPEQPVADAWPELARAREEGLSQIQLRDAPDGTPVINAAVPVGLNGATLLTTRNAIDITEKVRQARSTLGIAVFVALLGSIFLSLYLARTIVRPLQSLARAAVRVRLGREREVEVPRLPDRRDEIGALARAVSDMTNALRQRIDAVEHFAADVAHEIKNPLASLRSAIESLGKVDDPDLRQQLTGIAAHDIRRIDRLVTEISDASRVDAEISRTTFERFDLGDLAAAIIAAREDRAENDQRRVELSRPMGGAQVMGVPLRLERVIENLLDNAVSFSPPGGVIEVTVSHDDHERVVLSVCDQGPGIPEDSREKVFQRFHSVRPDAEAFGNHSGLGLAIARTIVEAHDGTLEARGRPDGTTGACLVLSLPAAIRSRH
ncbi:sensor histidine kinase [Pelagerythrobacter rhizovicinus]|uniref:histidine kinase n=1 Tax=Pelagerythrobacter rhizovicinus TaxID=2268576 RepID=A0A4Q2KT15_9SPHN|nr:HAMP domain-containing sensor histidine kinase [Pelagerythrobacter rhizovicinus]RXZ66461.1 HAMP domain-containing histidine kinase [Pelagerythrobacter rhizovicinus]